MKTLVAIWTIFVLSLGVAIGEVCVIIDDENPLKVETAMHQGSVFCQIDVKLYDGSDGQVSWWEKGSVCHNAFWAKALQ